MKLELASQQYWRSICGISIIKNDRPSVKLMPLLKVGNILEGALLDIEKIGSGVIIIVVLLRRIIDKGKSENRETKLKRSISKQRQSLGD